MLQIVRLVIKLTWKNVPVVKKAYSLMKPKVNALKDVNLDISLIRKNQFVNLVMNLVDLVLDLKKLNVMLVPKGYIK